MHTLRDLIILPARGCRRSRRLLDFLQAHAIPFTRIDLESPDGQALAERHDFRASPASWWTESASTRSTC